MGHWVVERRGGSEMLTIEKGVVAGPPFQFGPGVLIPALHSPQLFDKFTGQAPLPCPACR